MDCSPKPQVDPGSNDLGVCIPPTHGDNPCDGDVETGNEDPSSEEPGGDDPDGDEPNSDGSPGGQPASEDQPNAAPA